MEKSTAVLLEKVTAQRFNRQVQIITPAVRFAHDVRAARIAAGLTVGALAEQLSKTDLKLGKKHQIAKGIAAGESHGFCNKDRLLFLGLCLALGMNPKAYMSKIPDSPNWYIVKFGKAQAEAKDLHDTDQDIFAYVAESADGWQVFTAPANDLRDHKTNGKLYVDSFGGVYDLNKPKQTREEAEEHLALLAVLRGWQSCAGDVFRLAVWSKLKMLGFYDVNDKGEHAISADARLKFFKDDVKLRSKYDLETFTDFLQLKTDITPAKRDMKKRNLYFRLCKGLNIHPNFAGFGEGV